MPAKMLNLRETVTTLFAEKIGIQKRIPMGVQMNTSIDSRLDHSCEAMTLTLVSYLTRTHSKPRVHSFYYPATWWQMFKRDHFPSFLLDRFPVKMDREGFHYEAGTFVCPHMEIDWRDQKHVDFITMQVDSIEENRQRGEELCGQLLDKPWPPSPAHNQ